MKLKTLRVGIVGAGLIGGKRAGAILSTKQGEFTVVADSDFRRAKALADRFGAEALADWRSLVSRKDIDAVIVAVPNAFAAPIVFAALKNKKHVLCEKPFGITAKESAHMLAAAERVKKLVKVGFNHRFHPGIRKAHEIFERGGIGKILFIRARYGHGGRKGMEKEWRFNKKVSGGGELLDQGIHLVDLARWFAGEFTSVYGLARAKFWKTKLDDNAFALLENDRVTVSLHASATQWKNLFSFEIFGDRGYLEVEGKGGSYGEEVLTWGKTRLGFAPELAVFRFGKQDESWKAEWKNFVDAVKGGKKLIGDAADGLRASQIVEAIYRSSRTGRKVKL